MMLAVLLTASPAFSASTNRIKRDKATGQQHQVGCGTKPQNKKPHSELNNKKQSHSILKEKKENW